MLEKQKKDGGKFMSDTERIHQILLELGYYKEEELEMMNLSTINVTQEKTVEYKIAKTLNFEKKQPMKTLLPTLERYSEHPRK